MRITNTIFKERVAILSHLQKQLEDLDSTSWQQKLEETKRHNPWFTPAFVKQALVAIRDEFLDSEKLVTWLSAYSHLSDPEPKSVGIVMAGNIPLAGFHDWLCVWLSGHHAKVKLSEKDAILMPYIVELLESAIHSNAEAAQIAPSELRTSFVDRLSGYDAVIATGSNNSARYFEAYFGNKPHIIRRNRNSVAVLTGNETTIDLQGLAQDMLQYFGLGCRSVSKLYVPRDYDFSALQEVLEMEQALLHHHKFRNNYDYNLTLLLMNQTSYRALGPVLLVEHETFASRIANVHLTYYENLELLNSHLAANEESMQCVVAAASDVSLVLGAISMGTAQQPALQQYADGVDTLEFLMNL